MLVGYEDVVKVSLCPRTGGRLVEKGGSLASDADSSVVYDVIGGVPVLVDFDKSVIAPPSKSHEDFRTPVRRDKYEGLSLALKKMVSSGDEITEANITRLLSVIRPAGGVANVLVIGGGTVGQGMGAIYDDPSISLFSFDIYSGPNINFIADAHNIPIISGFFDAVIIQAVLEHVLRPEQVVSEIGRVLKPGGYVYAETPFLQHVHEGAYDFTRYTDSGHRYLFRQYELISSGVNGGAGSQLVWSIDYFFRGLFRSRNVGKFFKLMFFWLKYFDRLIPSKYSVDAACGCYFLGRKTDNAISDRQIIEYYKGAQ